jgi:hypothetical protein
MSDITGLPESGRLFFLHYQGGDTPLLPKNISGRNAMNFT